MKQSRELLTDSRVEADLIIFECSSIPWSLAVFSLHSLSIAFLFIESLGDLAMFQS